MDKKPIWWKILSRQIINLTYSFRKDLPNDSQKFLHTIITWYNEARLQNLLQEIVFGKECKLQ